MTLFDNPFYLLGARARDTRQRIVELAEEKSLFLDTALCAQARMDLINPRRRIVAEMAWLPGISAAQADSIIAQLASPDSCPLVLDDLTPLARANVLCTALAGCDEDAVALIPLSDWIQEIAKCFEQCQVRDLMVVINNDRSEAGFPAISDTALIEEELKNRARFFVQTMHEALNKLDSQTLIKIFTGIVERATSNGTRHAPRLIEDLVEAYETKVQAFLDKIEGELSSLHHKIHTEAMENASDDRLDSLVNQFISKLQSWDTHVKPIQIYFQSEGRIHEPTIVEGYCAHNLVYNLFNSGWSSDNLHQIYLSKKIIEINEKIFADWDEISEKISEYKKEIIQIEQVLQRRAELVLEKQARIINRRKALRLLTVLWSGFVLGTGIVLTDQIFTLWTTPYGQAIFFSCIVFFGMFPLSVLLMDVDNHRRRAQGGTPWKLHKQVLFLFLIILGLSVFLCIQGDTQETNSLSDSIGRIFIAFSGFLGIYSLMCGFVFTIRPLRKTDDEKTRASVIYSNDYWMEQRWKSTLLANEEFSKEKLLAAKIRLKELEKLLFTSPNQEEAERLQKFYCERAPYDEKLSPEEIEFRNLCRRLGVSKLPTNPCTTYIEKRTVGNIFSYLKKCYRNFLDFIAPVLILLLTVFAICIYVRWGNVCEMYLEKSTDPSCAVRLEEMRFASAVNKFDKISLALLNKYNELSEIPREMQSPMQATKCFALREWYDTYYHQLLAIYRSPEYAHTPEKFKDALGMIELESKRCQDCLDSIMQNERLQEETRQWQMKKQSQ